MSKRAYGSAFQANMPEVILATAYHGFGAPQLQDPPSLPSSSSLLLHIPGQWPQTGSDVPPSNSSASASQPASIFSTIGKLASSVSIGNLVRLPAYLAQRFFRRQTIRAEPVVREDGARKKRLIDVGLVREPHTPTKARALNARRNKQNNRASSPATPSSLFVPGMWPSSPVVKPQFSVAIQNSPSSTLASPLSSQFSPAVSDVTNDDSLDFSWSDDPDFHMSTSPTPINGKFTYILDDSESIAAESPLSALRPTNMNLSQQSSDLSPVANVSPPLVSNGPNVWPIHQSLVHTSFNQAPQSSWSASSLSKPNAPLTASPLRKTAKVTPVHKLLLRTQFKNQYPQGLSPPRAHADHTVPSPRNLKGRELSKHEKDSIALKNAASKIAKDAQQANDKYKIYHDSRAIGNADSRAEEDDNAEIDINKFALSFLFPRTPTYDNDLSTLSDAPSPPPPKAVRFAEKQHTKTFYVDELVSDMHDSTLESIKSSPVKFLNALAQPVINYITSTPESTRENVAPSPEQPQNTEDAVGFRGVPPETWDDSEEENSLDETQLSLELIEDLQDKLVVSTSPVQPASTIQPLVAPLNEDEKKQLEDIVKKTNSGCNPNVEPVPGKLSNRDFGTLLPFLFSGNPSAWLNDNVVNEYLTILVDHLKKEAGYEHKRNGAAPPVHAFSSFWYTNMKKKNGYQKVERWASKKQLGGKNFLDAKLLFFPICDKSHWRLLLLKPRERLIEYFDSLGLDGSDYLKTMHEYLKQELKEDYIADEWQTIQKQRSTRQVNTSDCGVFTVLNALVLLRDEEPVRVLACDGMQDARDRIAITLLTGKPTTELN